MCTSDAHIVLQIGRCGKFDGGNLNRRHLIDDPALADRSKFRIGTPGAALPGRGGAWRWRETSQAIRTQITLIRQ
jgi:hypothetical protein